jgi:hypothetical protein
LPSRKSVTEHDIQSTILDWLALHRIFHYRQNTGKIIRSYGGKTRCIAFGAKGAPDIVAVIGGIYVGIEVKALGKEATKEQAAFGKNLTDAGGRYIVARCLEDVEHVLGGGE